MQLQKIFYNKLTGNIVSINVPSTDAQVDNIQLPLPTTQMNILRYWCIDLNTRTLRLKSDQLQIQSRDELGRIRGRRDALLTSTDWTQMPDVALTAEQKAAWADYRQQLRDITDQLPDIIPTGYDVPWPTRPI